ncbi:hypothetical protein VPH35_012376 [Triticum aestivum]
MPDPRPRRRRRRRRILVLAAAAGSSSLLPPPPRPGRRRSFLQDPTSSDYWRLAATGYRDGGGRWSASRRGHDERRATWISWHRLEQDQGMAAESRSAMPIVGFFCSSGPCQHPCFSCIYAMALYLVYPAEAGGQRLFMMVST